MVPVNKEILKDEVQWLMEAINEQFDAIINYDGKIPQIEFDIIMENVRKLYEKLHMLQRSDDPFAYFEEKVREIPVFKSKIPVISMEEREFREEPEEKPEAEMTAVHEPQQESVPEPVEEMASGLDNEHPEHFSPGPASEKIHEKSKYPEPDQGIDLFSDAGSGFTERLKEAREKNLGSRGRRPKSDDLKSAISINEKFMIINELFSGNLRDYNEMIEKLNGFHDLPVALEFLDLLRKKNLWDTGTPVFLRLKELVEARF